MHESRSSLFTPSIARQWFCALLMLMSFVALYDDILTVYRALLGQGYKL